MDIRNQIIQYLNNNKESSSTTILAGIKTEKSLATLKRILSTLVDEKSIETVGKGKSTKYKVSPYYKLFENIDITIRAYVRYLKITKNNPNKLNVSRCLVQLFVVDVRFCIWICFAK